MPSLLLHTHLDGRRDTNYVVNKDLRQEDDGESESRYRRWSLISDTKLHTLTQALQLLLVS